MIVDRSVLTVVCSNLSCHAGPDHSRAVLPFPADLMFTTLTEAGWVLMRATDPLDPHRLLDPTDMPYCPTCSRRMQ